MTTWTQGQDGEALGDGRGLVAREPHQVRAGCDQEAAVQSSLDRVGHDALHPNAV